MRSVLSRVFAATLILSFCFAGPALSAELVILKGDGLKRDVTLSDMQKYVGGLADVSQKTWEAFIGQMPGALSVAKDAMNAIAVHQELSKGNVAGAAKNIMDYGIGLVAGEWENAGYAPLATMMTAFTVYDASLDFINSQWFKPALIDSVYDKYKLERDEGQTHRQVWENFGTYFINPIKADVKNKVIYPRHDLKDMGDDKKKATRGVTGKVGQKKIKVTYMDKSNWPYSQAQKVYIRHSGKGTEPVFATLIDIQIWDLSDINGTALDIINSVYKLNDIKYPDLKNRFTNAQMDELKGKLKGMLKELKDKDIGPELDAEAEEYIGQMLETRYAQEAARKLAAVTEEARPGAESSLLDVARQLKQFEPPVLQKKWVSFDGYKMQVPAAWSISRTSGGDPVLQVLEGEENALIELYVNRGDKTGVEAYADTVELQLGNQPYMKQRVSSSVIKLPGGVDATFRAFKGQFQGEAVDAVIMCAYSGGFWYIGLGVYRSSMESVLAEPVISGLKSLTFEKAAPGPQSIVGTWKYVLSYHPNDIGKTVTFRSDGTVAWITSDGSVTNWKEAGESYRGCKTYLLGTTYKTGGNFIRKFTVFLSDDGNSLYVASGQTKHDVLFFTRQ